jgi:hypothetical protein
VALGNEPDGQRQSAVLLPKPQGVVDLGFDAGTATEHIRDDLPAIRVNLTQIGIREVRTPMILVGAVLGEGEVVVPVPEVEDEMEMEAFSAAVDDLISSVVLEALENFVSTTQAAALDRP